MGHQSVHRYLWRATVGDFCRVLLFLWMAAGFVAALHAQVVVTPDQLQQYQFPRANPFNDSTAVTPREVIIEPTSPAGTQPTSELERILSGRSGRPLRQIGYDQLGVGRSVTLPQVGAMQDDYVLGSGDEIVVTTRGQENNEFRAIVDRDGKVTFPKMNPVLAMGRTFGQFRADLMSAINRAYMSTKGFVSLGRMRQISVLVSGEVASPGVRTLTGLSTVVDAVLVSGGISKSGSLRNVQILRRGRVITVDLYGVLIGGSHLKSTMLADGDKIIVPPIGATIAIAGEMRRPGIYELPAGRTAISVREAMAMASGTQLPGHYTVSLLRTLPDGKRQLIDVSSGYGSILREGEIVIVKTSVDISVDQVTLTGAVRVNGTVSRNRFKSLHDLLPSSEALRPDAYMLMGIVDRTDPATLQRVALPFSPLRVVQGKEDIMLMSDDVVHVLTKPGMRALVSALQLHSQDEEERSDDRFTAAIPEPGDAPNSNRIDTRTSGANAGSRAVSPAAGSAEENGEAVSAAQNELPMPASPAMIAATPRSALQADMAQVSSARSATMDAAGRSSAATLVNQADQANRAHLTAPDTDMGGFTYSDGEFYARVLADYISILSGAVRDPGTYLVAPGTTLTELLAAAGGLKSAADLSSFELTSSDIDNRSGSSTTTRKWMDATADVFANYVLKPGDGIHFRRIYSAAAPGEFVTVRGEVRYPGTFSILRGERLSSLLRRAGGFTPFAYPLGAVFTRESVAEGERATYAREAADLRSQLLNSVMLKPSVSTSPPISGDTIRALQGLVAQIQRQTGVGRMSVSVDPEVLKNNPQLDIMLEAGDKIVIPKQPTSVTVSGEVLSPGTFVWDEAASISDYLAEAGGLSEFADSNRIIVVLPDGRAHSAERSWLSIGSGSKIPPGSMIVVFRDMAAIDSQQLITSVTAVFSQLAMSAAALAVLSKY